MHLSKPAAPKPVVIVGGGIAGLACAVALVRAGIPVELHEGSERFGGRAQSVVDAETGDVVDIGPHVLTAEHRNMLSLMEILGTRDRVCWQPDQFITIVDDGCPVMMRNYSLPAPFHFLPNFFHVNKLSIGDIWSARRVLWRVMRMSEADIIGIDDRHAEAVLREMGVSRNFIDWFWRTACMAVMNVPLESCSAGSLFRFLKMMAGRNDFYFGFPRLPLSDLFVPGALAYIREAGSDVNAGSAVNAVQVDGGRVRGIGKENGETREADQCVLAIPPAALAHLHVSSAALPRIRLQDFLPSPYISTYLWFDRKLTGRRFWARRWSVENLNYDFYDLSNIRDDPSDLSLVATNVIYSHRARSMTDAEIVRTTLKELGEFLPEATEERLLHARVHRIAMAICAPWPGFERCRPETRCPGRGLYLAGDWTRTALPESMESAVRSGFLAAEAVAADRGVELRCALPLRQMRGLAGLLRVAT